MSSENLSKNKLKDMLKDELVAYADDLQAKLRAQTQAAQKAQEENKQPAAPATMSEMQKTLAEMIKIQAIQMGVYEGDDAPQTFQDTPHKVKPWKRISDMSPIEKTLWRILNKMEWYRLEKHNARDKVAYAQNISNLQNKFVRLCERERAIPRDEGLTEGERKPFSDQYALDDQDEIAAITFQGKEVRINFNAFYKGWKAQAAKEKLDKDKVKAEFWGMSPEHMQI